MDRLTAREKMTVRHIGPYTEKKRGGQKDNLKQRWYIKDTYM